MESAYRCRRTQASGRCPLPGSPRGRLDDARLIRPIALSLSAFALALGAAAAPATAAPGPAPATAGPLFSQSYEDGQAAGWWSTTWMQPVATTAAARTGARSLLAGTNYDGDTFLKIPTTQLKVGTWYELWAYAKLAPNQPRGYFVLDAGGPPRNLLNSYLTTTAWTKIGVRFQYAGDAPRTGGYGDVPNDGYLTANLKSPDACLWVWDLRVYLDDLTLTKADVQGSVAQPTPTGHPCD